MSEQSRTPRWIKVALVIQMIVICAGLLLYVLSIRMVSHVQLPTRFEQSDFVEAPTVAPAAASPDVPAAPPGRIHSMPSAYGPNSEPSMGADNFLPSPSLSAPIVSNTAEVNPTLSNAQLTNPQSSNPQSSKKEHSNEEVTNQAVPDSETPNSNPPAVNETVKQETFPGSKNEMRVFKIQRGSPNETAKTVKEIFDNSVKVSADERSNSLIVVASPPTLVKVTAFIEEMEKRAELAFMEEKDKQAVAARAENKPANRYGWSTNPGPSTSNSVGDEDYNARDAKLLTLQKKVMRSFGPEHPKVRDLQDQIDAEQARLTAENPKQGSQRDPVTVKDVKNPVGRFPFDEGDVELERQAKQLALQIRTARPNEKGKLKKELEAITRKQFEHRQNRRREEFDSLSQRVERLKASYQRRQAHQDEVIQRRINDLLDPNTDLRWDETETTGESLSSSNEATDVNDNAIETAMQSSPFARKMSSNKSLPSNLEETEPTYKSLTLSQWMRLLETERNIESIAEVVGALNHLMDQADPTQLTRAILHIMRVHGSRQDDRTTSVIRNGSVNLLKLLPSEIVVEELISELATSSYREPTRDFYAYFLSSVGSKGATETRYDFWKNAITPEKNEYMLVDSTTLLEANQRLSVEIRRRSRRLIGVLVNAAAKDENLANWAMRCSAIVVRISNQPITTYPGLIPLVEKMFDHPVDVPKGSSNSNFYSGSVAPFLLGKSGLRVPELLAYAAARIQEENNPSDPRRFDEGVLCLVTIAPFSTDAVNLLGETLATKWEALIDFDEKLNAFNAIVGGFIDPKKSPPDTATGDKLKLHCWRIIKAYAEIGKPAASAIPQLAAIAESPRIIEFVVAKPGEFDQFVSDASAMSVMRPVPKMAFQDMAKSVIKKIEEAKPKPEPQPLPDDDEISTPISIPVASNRKPGDSAQSRDAAANAIKTAIQETSSVNTTPSSKSLPNKPHRSGPTYNGVTLSEWLSLLEFERNPEKIAEAVMAMFHLKDQADPRQLTRMILSVIRVQGANQFDDPTRTIMNGSVRLLTLLPSEIVVDEIIADLPTSSSQQPARAFYGYFFNALGSREVSNAYLDQKNMRSVDSTILSESMQRLRAEIRRRSRRLINVLVNAAILDESSFVWAVHNANTIVHISDQRIATYPDLVGIVEKLFDQGVDDENGTSRISRAYAAIMLGKSGLRVPDVLAFAAKGFQEENEVFDSPQFDDCIRCLVAIAPFSPDAVNLLGETLATRWKTLLELRDEQIVNPQKREVKRIIDALVEIGRPAVPAIPKLAAIAEFPKIVKGPLESGMGSMMGMPGMAVAPAMTFQELAKSAIKKIKEAKPMSDPQPLPDDIEISSRKPSGSAPIRDATANAIKAATQETPSVKTTPSSQSLPSTPDQLDPTYNNVTLSQWLRMLETERNPEKIAEAVMAMHYLRDQADPRQLTKTILRLMRFQGSSIMDHDGNVIMNGSVLLLKLLPSEIVVEELIAEITASSSLKPTQDFFIYFFNSIGWKGTTDVYIGSPSFKMVNATTLSESTDRLRAEIRRRSRRLISTLIKVAAQDDSLANWVMHCANVVVRVSDQRITTYPGLVPLVEKLFENPAKLPSNVVNSVYTPWPVAEPLLGESGLQVPKILELATEKIHDHPDNGTFQFEYGIRCLIAIAPSSPEAVNLLGETLEIYWTEILNRVPPGSKPQIGSDLKFRCKRMIDALAEIGKPAQSAIPKLAEIADSPSVHVFAIENSMMSPAPTMKFQDLAKSAIKKIEDAKPKPDPQPLPDDVEVSMVVPISRPGKPGVSPVTDQPLHELETPVSDPKAAETTYDGITYSQWLKLLETERKPEKLIAAIGTCSLLAAKGDERRIARQIFLAEGFFETENWSKERRDAWDAGSDALARLPGDAVVDEFLYALRDEKSFSAGRGFQAFFLTRTEAIPHAVQMRVKAAEVITELLKRHSTLLNPKETHNNMLVAASSVWRNSGKPMKDFDGLSPQLTKLLADGFSIKNTPEFEQWMIAARNVVLGAPDTPDLANLLLAHAKKHEPYGYPLIELIGKLGPRAETVVSQLVDLFLEELKKLELLPSLIRRSGQGVTFPAGVPNAEELHLQRVIAVEDQKMRVQLIRTLGEIGVGASGYQLLSELKLIAFRPSSQRYFEFLDEIFLAVDTSLSQFGSTKYPRDEKRLLSDLWRLNGRWKVVTRFENTAAAEPLQDFIVQIRDNQFSWETAPPKGHILNEFMNSLDIRRGNMTYKVTVIEAMSRKQLMLAANVRLPPGQGTEGLRLTMTGIYEVTDYKLKVQFAQPDQPSPTEFPNEMGQVPEGQMLLEFERIVPDAT